MRNIKNNFAHNLISKNTHRPLFIRRNRLKNFGIKFNDPMFNIQYTITMCNQKWIEEIAQPTIYS